jgi:hypothetical protein
MTRIRLLIFFSLLLPLAGPVGAQSGGEFVEATDEAQAAAQSWLDRVDAGAFEASWEAAAALLRQRTEQANWVEQARRLRDTMRTVSDRTLTARRYRDTLPRARNEGPFVLLAYRSTYEGGSVNEVLVTVQEDTTWKVAGYRVTPQHEASAQAATAPDSRR